MQWWTQGLGSKEGDVRLQMYCTVRAVYTEPKQDVVLFVAWRWGRWGEERRGKYSRSITRLLRSLRHTSKFWKKGTKPSIPSFFCIRVFTVHAPVSSPPPSPSQPRATFIFIHPVLILILTSIIPPPGPTNRSERVILRRNLPLPVAPNDGNLHHDVVSQFGHVCGEEDDEEAEDTAEGCEGSAAVGGWGRLAGLVLMVVVVRDIGGDDWGDDNSKGDVGFVYM